MGKKIDSRYMVASAVLLVLTFIVFWLSYTAIWLGDDTFFSFKFADSDGLQRVRSLRDIIESQSHYYMERNGRFMTHCLVQFFCGIAGQTAFAVCNALMWVAFAVIITRVAGYKCSRSPWTTFVVAATAFVCLRTQFTPPCQINYIWAMTAALVVVHCFFSDRKWPAWAVLLLALLALVAGWGQESFSSGLSAALWIYALLHFRSMRAYQWLWLVAMTAGMLCLCLAPGNFAKMGTFSSLRITPFAAAYFMRATHALVLLALVLLLCRKTSLLRVYRENAFWFNAMFFMVVFNLIVKVYCNRQLFGIEVVSIIIIVRLLHRYLDGMRWLKAIIGLVLAALMVAVFVDDVNIISRRKAVVAEVKKLFDQSADGIIYYDIENEDFLYHDEDPVWSVNYWAFAELGRLWQSQGDSRLLEWRPAAVKAIQGKRLESQVIKVGEQQDTYLLVYAKGDTTSTFRLTEERAYGPFVVAHYENDYSAAHLQSQYGTNIIEDTYFNVTVHRQNDVFVRFTDARLLSKEEQALTQ